jgi:hypothetical protein
MILKKYNWLRLQIVLTYQFPNYCLTNSRFGFRLVKSKFVIIFSSVPFILHCADLMNHSTINIICVIWPVLISQSPDHAEFLSRLPIAYIGSIHGISFVILTSVWLGPFYSTVNFIIIVHVIKIGHQRFKKK